MEVTVTRRGRVGVKEWHTEYEDNAGPCCRSLMTDRLLLHPPMTISTTLLLKSMLLF
ncbi:hypothetical protein DPMN_012321 [Dreissena polymorpha]|uniref:Uncharacterized protein n=1 Tax=Dreissena polymorpha TaxID=45954 RepID=A0A9D4N6T4_DREPO|nr:hypothetical protein DPMN_012321 [Dreissena polymorpha]